MVIEQGDTAWGPPADRTLDAESSAETVHLGTNVRAPGERRGRTLLSKSTIT